MAIVDSSGYVVVDSDPNGIAELQGGQKQLLAISEDGLNQWRFIAGGTPGSLWQESSDAVSKIEVPLTAFADDYNPLTSEVVTWVSTNLTTEQKENSLLYALSPIPTRPLIYTYPTTSTTLNRIGADQASLTSIIINGNTHAIGLPLETAGFVGLESTDMAALEAAIKAKFLLEGHTVEVICLYTNTQSTQNIIIRVVQQSGSTPFTVRYVHVNNSGTTTSSLQTNTPTVASSQTLNTDTITKPNFVWSIVNDSVTEIFRFKPTDTKYVETTVLPTFSAANHINGLIVKDTTHGSVYISDGSAWNNIFTPTILIDTQLVQSTSYQGTDRVTTNFYVKYQAVSPFTIPNTFYSRVIVTLPSGASITTDLSSYTSSIEVGGNIYYTGNASFHDENVGGLIKSYRTDASAHSIGFSVTGASASSATVGISITIFDNADNVISTVSLGTGINKSAGITLDELISTQHNTRLRNYTTTQRDSVTLNNTTDRGKEIFNTTNFIEEGWSGTDYGWMNRLDKRWTVISYGGTPQPTYNVETADIFEILDFEDDITNMSTNRTGTVKHGKILQFNFKDDGTPRAIGWGADFADTTIALPLITVASTKLRVMVQYDSSDSLFHCVGVV